MAAQSRSFLTRLIAGRFSALSGAGREIREEAGLSLAEVAHAVGVDKGTLSRWERGLARPRRSQALRYEEVLREVVKAMVGSDER